MEADDPEEAKDTALFGNTVYSDTGVDEVEEVKDFVVEW